MNIERRKCDRQAVDFKIDFHCCGKGCNGNANNISTKGMFIKTRKICFPVNTHFDIYYSTNGKVLQIPVKLSRLARSEDIAGIGISFIKALKRNVSTGHTRVNA